MQFRLPFVLSAVSLMLVQVPLGAQQAAPLPETKVVLRIQRGFLQELTGTQLQRREAINTSLSSTAIRGQAEVDCTFAVKLHPNETECAFDLEVQGSLSTQLLASSRSVQVSAHGLAPFQAQRRFVFDGEAFTGAEISLTVEHHSNVDQIGSTRGGLIGAMTRRVARSRVQDQLPITDRRITDEIRTQLTKALQEECDQRMVELNAKIKPMVKEAESLLRTMKVLPAGKSHRYFAATEEHLFMSIGPAGHRMPVLPARGAAKQAPIELWIALDKGEVKGLVAWELIKPVVYRRMTEQAPELAKLIDLVRVDTFQGWHVVTFTPKVLYHG